MIRKMAILTVLMLGSGLQGMDSGAPGATEDRAEERYHAWLAQEEAKEQAGKQYELNAQLVEAAYKGDKLQVERLIKEGAHVNAPEGSMETPLSAAILGGHEDLCKLLIERGANVNAEAGGMTPLIFAVTASRYNPYNVCKLLIASHVDLNAKDTFNGMTALMYAAGNGKKDLCELLIANGADLHGKDNHGSTALMRGASTGKKDVCELLIANGADLHAKDNDGFSALGYAGGKGNKEVCELLINAMVKPTEKELAPIVAMLGLQKKGQDLKLVGRNVVQLIGKDAYNQIVQPKRKAARDAIMEIKDEQLQKQLLDYLNRI